MDPLPCDCVIMGGGPAGATAATVLADHGHRVHLLEKTSFPRHHIGESLMPATYWTFRRIGMLEKLARSDFPRKQSVQFINAFGGESQPFYFTDFDPGAPSVTWQVPRPQFDQMMLDNAREHGATVTERARVREVRFAGRRAVGVRAECNGRLLDIPAKVVVDASGQSAVLARQLKLREGDAQLKNASIYTYYRGAARDAGRNAGATIVINTPERDGWFWSIPLPEDITSIGLVARPEVLWAVPGQDPEMVFETAVARCPGLAGRLRAAARVGPVHVTRDFSYRAGRIAGDGWVLIGDAFGFLDPVYSSGVMLALKSGEWAADAIHQGLLADDLSAGRLGAFAPEFVAGMQRIRQLVYAFYDPQFSFAKFIRAHPEYHDHLVRILMGDVFNEQVGTIFEAMRGWVDLPGPIPLQADAQAL